MDDFRKIDSTGKASLLFSAIPAELNKNTSRYKVSNVVEAGNSNRTSEILMDMIDSMTVNICYHANDPAAGLSLHRDTDKFKLFMADTGLFITLAFMDKSYTDNVIYTKILSNKLDTNLGYIYENVVAQMLIASGYNLFYYTFAKPNDNNHYYELDFLLTHRDKICPLEVKSSGYKTHKSLDAFQDKYSSRISQRYLIYTKDLRKEQDIICVPAYMTPLL
jgi:predicted AAA+ superfamily ATPase